MKSLDFLAQHPTFKDFSREDLAALAEQSDEARFERDQPIFEDEDPGDRMYIIRSGSVKIYKTVKQFEKTLTVLSAGDVFGEMALLDGQPRSASARPLEGTEVVVLPKAKFQALRERHPKVALKLMDLLVRFLSQRLRAANKNLEVISFWID